MAKVVGIDTSKMKRITHSACGAIIEYFPNEVKTFVKSDYGGGSDVYNYITCPHCGKDITWC